MATFNGGTGAEEIHGRGSNDVVNAGMGGDGHDTTGDFNHYGDPDHLRHGGQYGHHLPGRRVDHAGDVKAGTLDATDFSFHQKLAVDGIQTGGGRRASQSMSLTFRLRRRHC